MALQTQVSATPEFRPWQQSCSTPGRALRYPSHVWPRRWACFLQALRLGPGARRDRQPRGHSWPGPELAAPVLVHLCLGDRGDAGVPPARWPCRAVPSLRQRPYRHQFRTRTNTPATRLLASWHPCGCAHAPTEARSLTLIPRLPPTRTPRRSPGWSRPVHADTPSSPPSRQLNCCQSAGGPCSTPPRSSPEPHCNGLFQVADGGAHGWHGTPPRVFLSGECGAAPRRRRRGPGQARVTVGNTRASGQNHMPWPRPPLCVKTKSNLDRSKKESFEI